MQKAYEFDFVYDTQAAFRLLLEALSNPGRIVELGPLARKLGGAYAMPLTVAAVLLDNEVSFAVCGSPALAEKITELTLAKTAAVSKADYIIVRSDIKRLGRRQGVSCCWRFWREFSLEWEPWCPIHRATPWKICPWPGWCADFCSPLDWSWCCLPGRSCLPGTA